MQIDGFSFTFQESFLKSYGFTILPCFYHVLLIFLVKMLTLVMLFLNGPIKGIFWTNLFLLLILLQLSHVHDKE